MKRMRLLTAAVAGVIAISGCGKDEGPARATGGAPGASAAPSISGPASDPDGAGAGAAPLPDQRRGKPWWDETRPAAAGDPVGPKGSTCELPVSFAAPKDWKIKKTTLDGGPLDDLAREGGFTVACEIDAKPAGVLGLMQVFRQDEPGAELKAAVDGHLKAQEGVVKRQDRTVTAGGLPALEVSYGSYSKVLEVTRLKRALAVQLPNKEIILLSIGGLDEEEHLGLLSGLRLAHAGMRST
ncbi:hypothetical protein GCM10010201_05040 [Pilimelia columellifera subsp. columellifera]|uniref:Lipoprotein n=2 Tax=Pilimelia TaxID=53370 RepID=A0ABP6A8V3_9ACTN